MIGKAIAVGLAVLERRRKHLLAGLEREFVRRELFLLFPLPVQILIHRIRTVGEILRLQLGEFVGEELLERLGIGHRVRRVGGDRRLRCQRRQHKRC